MFNFLRDPHMEIKLDIHGNPELVIGTHHCPVIDRDEFHNWEKVETK